MQSALKQAVEQFRLGMEGGGNAALVDFIDQLTKVLSAAPAHELAQDLLPFLQRIISAAERGDYLWIADLLEYEIEPRLITAQS